jgi:hypothetical protein
MRILIQNCKTSLFLTSDLLWTDRPQDAVQFKSAVGGYNFIHDNLLADVQLLFQFGDSEFEFRTPVTKGCQETP